MITWPENIIFRFKLPDGTIYDPSTNTTHHISSAISSLAEAGGGATATIDNEVTILPDIANSAMGAVEKHLETIRELESPQLQELLNEVSGRWANGKVEIIIDCAGGWDIAVRATATCYFVHNYPVIEIEWTEGLCHKIASFIFLITFELCNAVNDELYNVVPENFEDPYKYAVENELAEYKTFLRARLMLYEICVTYPIRTVRILLLILKNSRARRRHTVRS